MATELYELKVSGLSGAQPNMIVMHFVGGNLTADDTGNNGAFLIDAWQTNLQSFFLAALPDDYSLVLLQARRATPKPSIVTHHQYVRGDQPGTGGSGTCTSQLCPCIHVIPGMGFKSVGRIFLPAVYDGAIANNAYDSGYITAVGNWFTAMLSNFGTSGKTWQLAVYSRKLNIYSLATGGGLSSRFGFQRRRRVAW